MLSGNAAMAPGGGGTRTLVVETLAWSGSGTLDLAGHALIVNDPSAAQATAIRAALTTGYADGAWTGAGIATSAARSQRVGTLGSALANDLEVIPSVFANKTVIATSQLVRFTLAGDATLDGQVDFSDLLALARAYGTAGKTFAKGDFDYSTDGSVNFNDLLLLAKQYGTTLPAQAADEVVAKKTRSRRTAVAGIF